MRLLWICLGGAAGTAARYFVGLYAPKLLGTSFPFATLIVNVIGSFLLAAIMHIGLASDAMGDTMRLALATGVLGGFTTYSTFNYETLTYVREGAWAAGIANVVATIVLCLIAGIAGAAAGRAIVGS